MMCLICIVNLGRSEPSSPETGINNTTLAVTSSRLPRPTCILCSRRFKTESERDEHLIQHDKMNFMCPAAFCYCLFQTFRTLKDHHRSYHITTLKESDKTHCCINVGSTRIAPSENRYKCELCPREFFTKAMRDYHVAHHSEMRHVCPPPCGVTFPDFLSLQRHHIRHHGSMFPEAKHQTYQVNNENSRRQHEEARDKETVEMTHKKGNWSERLMCITCKRKFTSEDRKQFHEAHHDEMIYRCFCGNMFLKTHPLINHLYHSHGILLRTRQCFQYKVKKSIPKLRMRKNTFTNRWSSSISQSVSRSYKGKTKCHLCGRRFTSTLNTLYHIAHHSEMIYQCPRPCGNRLMYFNRLKQHTIDTHKVSISNRDENHFKINLPPVMAKNTKKALSCSICKRKFRQKELLQHHLNCHGKMIYECPGPQCSYLYLQWKYFQKHAIICHGLRVTKENKEQYKIKKKLSIEANQSQTERNNSFISRMVKTGNKCTTLRCDLCGRKFQTQPNKDFHEINHDKMVYRCPDPCGYMYMKLSILNKHSVSCHGKRFSGAIQNSNKTLCNGPTRTSGSASSSASSYSHSNEEPKPMPRKEKLKCHLCQRRFKSGADRAYHLKHHEDMRYKCPDPCGNQFLNFECMRKHSWNSHNKRLSLTSEHYLLKSVKKSSGTKTPKVRFKCSKCQRRFSTVKSRNEHLQRHGEMQFECPEPCGSMFLQFAALQQHVTKRHSFRLYLSDKEGCRIKKQSHQKKTADEEKNEQQTIQLQMLQSTTCVDGSANTNADRIEPQQNVNNECRYQKKNSLENSNSHEHKMMLYECPMIHPPCKNYFNTFYELHDHCEYNHNLRLRKEYEKAYRIQNTTSRLGHLGWPKCRHCGRVFKTEENRDKHMKNHDQLPYRCSVNQCGYLYDDLLSLKYHWRDVHKLKFKELDKNNYIVNYNRNDCLLNAKKSSVDTEGNSNKQENVLTLECHRELAKCQNSEESVAINSESGDHTGFVFEKGGNLVGSVEIHVTADGAAVMHPVRNNHSDGMNCMNLSPSSAVNHLDFGNDSSGKEKTVCQDLQEIMEILPQNPGDDGIVKNSSKSENVSAAFREDTGKLNADYCRKGNDNEMLLTDEQLDSSFDVINSLLDTDFLETFTADVFNYTVMPAEDPGEMVDARDSKEEVVTVKNAEDETETEWTLQIASCYSLTNPLNNISNDASSHDCDVLDEHSYALRRRNSWLPSSELVDTSNVNFTAEDATPASPESGTFSSLLNGVFSDLDKLPDLFPGTNSSPSSTPIVNVSVDSGVDTLCSAKTVTVDSSISKEGRQPEDVKDLATNDDPVIGLDTRYI